MADEYICKQDAVNMFNRAVQDVGILDADDIEIVFGMLSPVDVAPVVHSQWVLGGYDDMYYVCKRCGHKQSEYYHKPTANFCPDCGAKMDVRGEV